MSEKITLHTGDEEWNIQLEEPGPTEKLMLALNQPKDFNVESDITDEESKWIVQFLDLVTDIESYNLVDLNHVDESELLYLIESCVAIFEETEAELQSREEYFSEDRQTLIDEDGNVSKLYE